MYTKRVLERWYTTWAALSLLLYHDGIDEVTLAPHSLYHIETTVLTLWGFQLERNGIDGIDNAFGTLLYQSTYVHGAGSHWALTAYFHCILNSQT